jgi:hypothetical protein
MPPFGKESSEPSGRSIPFLSLSHAPLARAQKKVSKAFAAEGAERDALNPPGTGSSGVKKQQSRVTKSNESQSQPFKKGRQTSGPFGDENSEDRDQSDSDEQSEKDFEATSSSVFSLGWQQMLNFKQSNFWKESQDDESTIKKKRSYDNTNREANAAYLNQQKAGSFKKTGADPARVKAVLGETICRCTMDSKQGNPFVFKGSLLGNIT